ncbi:alpha/beta hydrolase family protein [Leptospira stimsonii]|uniref:Peptidase S9 prolyl oligopeptidase catalytic domain-containing protein n=1 Tax=Leptospira stimsonii TaxID=2202203 RepID=A0ABY2N1B8_9LEPT|nr:prolyl oligopeptidase family serine peptidase [Leptospira stimsonii]TGK19751.1 hypothetical protein EHO98_10730 [Leptospira stimsonii]TGM13750.1 hypothetical protein EHQ90_13125 [Leptospira stimsonii]
MYRTRFQKDIVAEFLPPKRKTKTQRLILLCDGMPSIPKKQGLVEFLSAKGYWVIYPRYRGAWESDGEFLKYSPHLDIKEIIDEVLDLKTIRENSFYKSFEVKPDEIFVIGGSFGGATALLSSLDSRVKKVIANCPVVDWKILKEEQAAETANPNYVSYLKETFGSAYRLPEKNWKKLYEGEFFNPAFHIKELNPLKIRMFHAVDDPYVPAKVVKDFADRTKIRLKLLKKGGHLSTDLIVRKYWDEIHRFFLSQ